MKIPNYIVVFLLLGVSLSAYASDDVEPGSDAAANAADDVSDEATESDSNDDSIDDGANEQDEDFGEDISDVADLDLDALLVVEEVETASKQAESEMDAPALVTVIDSETIRYSARTSLADLMRKVPGAYVMQVNAHTYNVGLRGFNRLSNNGALIQLDGRAVADPTIGFAPWYAMPINPGDLERIEVLHGPGSILYGADALTGVISLKTKRPLDHPGTEASFQGGAMLRPRAQGRINSNDWRALNASGYAAHSWVNESKTVGARLSLGFGTNSEWEELGEYTNTPGAELDPNEDQIAEYTHGPHHYHLNFSAQIKPSDKTEVYSQFSALSAEAMVGLGGLVASALPLHTDKYAAMVQFRRTISDNFSIRFQLDGRYETLYLPVNFDQLISMDSTIGHAMVQADLSLWNGRNKTSFGAEGTIERDNDIFEISPNKRYGGLFINNRLQLFQKPSVWLHAGARFEHIRFDDGGDRSATHPTISPRFALTASWKEKHGMWASASSAFRLPTPFEAFAVVLSDYTGTLPGPPSEFLTGDEELRSTNIRAAELGYRYRNPSFAALSVKLFGQQIRNITNLGDQVIIPFSYHNTSDRTQLGGLASLKFLLGPKVTATLNYAYTYTTQRSIDRITKERGDSERVKDWPSQIVGLNIDARISEKSRLTADYYFASSVFPEELDLSGGRFRINRQDVAPQSILNMRYGYQFADNSEFYMAGMNLLSFTREFDALKQYNIGSAHPIGTTLMIGLTLRQP